MQLGYQHRYEPVPPLREKNPAITVPPQLEQVVMKGLAKEPGQRFERIEAFANALEQALKPQEPIIVTPPTPPKPAIVSPPIGTTLVTYRQHTNVVRAVAWAPDGIHIASGSGDDPVQIWDARTGSQKSSNKANGQLAVAWSPEGKRLASGGIDTIVHLWDAAQQREILQYTGHSDWISALSWSPDGRYIVSGGGFAADKTKAHDFTLHIWDTTTGTRLSTYKGHATDVKAIQWSPDGRYIASGGGDNGVQVWEAATGKLVYTYTKHTGYVMAIAWSRDSRRLASGSLYGTVQVWDAVTGDNVLSYGGHTSSVVTVAWSPDGRQIASGGMDNLVHIWDAMTGKTIYTYKGHSDRVNALSWSPDSTRIASGGMDNTVQVWQAR